MAGDGVDPTGRRDAAVKARDNLYTTYLISPWTKRLLPTLSGKVSPNAVTATSVVLALLAAWLFSIGSLAATVAAAVVYQLSFAADCIDGQLARFDARETRVGALLDWQFDRIKETAVLTGIASGAGDEWLLAAGVLAVLAIRSAVTVGYGALAAAPAAATEPGGGWQSQARSALLLPYGDRHLVLGILAIAVGLRSTLVVLVLWNLVATSLQLFGRLQKTLGQAGSAERIDLHGDGSVASFESRMLRFPVNFVIAAPIALFALAMPQTSDWHPAHAVMLLGILLAGRIVPGWTGPLVTLGFELSSIGLLALADVSAGLVFAAVAATATLRHVVNSDHLTDGEEHGWRLDPLGWELRSVAWLLGAVVDPALAIAMVSYVAVMTTLRLGLNLAERRRLDLATAQ